MNARLIGRIETGVALLASALFAGAAGFAADMLLRDSVPQPQLEILAATAAALGFVLSNLAVREGSRVKRPFRTPTFELPDFEPFESDELLLSDADRLTPGEFVATDADHVNQHLAADGAEALVLDDVLAAIDPDSRVVRLFDRRAMPTPGQLQSQIDGHLGQRSSAAPAPDASQALSDALAELRRSLR